MKTTKTVVFLGDGMADEPLAELGHRTPLQAAATPAMDRIATRGQSGTLLTLPEGFPTSSDVANMSVLGCDLPTEYTGRGPLEALSQGIDLGPNDIAFRLNLSAQTDGVLSDHSGGHIPHEDAVQLIEALNERFASDELRFYPGVSYRNILVISGPQHSHAISTEKPDENHGHAIAEHLPVAKTPDAEATVALIRALIAEAPALLEAHPVNQRLAAQGKPMANAIWPWSPGGAGAARTLSDKWDVSGAVISAVDVVNGLGRMLDMEVITVDGATGYIDTNYEGKADAAIEALKRHDFVYVHIEGTDEVSHEQNLEKKLQAIEDFDKRLMTRVMDALGDDVAYAVLPDHPVPLRLGTHTRTPVPVSICMPGMAPDDVTVYDEDACPTGGLGAMKADAFMCALLGPVRA